MIFKTLFQHNYAYRNTLILVNRMQFKFNLFYTIWTKILVHGLSIKKKKKKKDLQSGLFFHLLQMYIKDPPPNAAKAGSKNLEKLTFGLSLKNNTYCTVKL